MSFTPTVATLGAAGAEKLRDLPMSPYAFGAIALGSFLLLLAVLWAFRNTAARYDTPIRVAHGEQFEPGDPRYSPGSTHPGAHH